MTPPQGSTMNQNLNVPRGTLSGGGGLVPTMGGVVPTMAGVVPTMEGIVPTMGGIIPTMGGVVPTMGGEVPIWPTFPAAPCCGDGQCGYRARGRPQAGKGQGWGLGERAGTCS